MSKDGGPPASSFTNPSKTGWLTKHGGHGLGANWKKRWFVLDNSYLFYYKGQNDKKPVGVVCLHDYRSCRKAEQKESKKSPFTFVLEKREDSDDTSGRNYLIFGESEEDMTSWIRALKKETQSSSPSPSPAPSPSVSAARVKKGGKGKQQQPQKAKKTTAAAAEVVDDKAFDELTLKVEEAPKLTHLTAERPRMRGRRPPRKYATFHEDDAKEDGEDDGSPVKLSPSPPSQPVSTPPVDSPSVSAKKGHHPIMPMKPKPRTATISNPSPPPSPKPTVTAKPSPPSAASKPSKSSPQGDESEGGGGAKKLPPIPPTKPKSTSMSKLEDNTVQNGEGKKSPPVPPVKPKPTSSSPPQDETAGKGAPEHEKQSNSPGLLAKQVSTPELAQKAVVGDKEAQHKRLKTAPTVAAKPVPKKRVPRPSGESGANVTLPAVESTETATTQPEPLQEKAAEKVEKKKEEKELSFKTESQEDLAKPVSTTPLKFNKPPAPRKPRGATNPSPKHKPLPVPRPRTGSNISSKSDDQVIEETKKEEIEEKEPKKDEEHPKKDGNEEVEVKVSISADSAPEDAPPVAEAVVVAAAAAVVVDEVVDESPPTASLNQTQEQKVEQTLNKEDTQQPTEPEKKEKEEKQSEVVIEVPTEVAEEIKEEEKKEVAVSDNGTTLEEKSEASEEKPKEMVSAVENESTKSTEELKPTEPDVTSPSRRIAYENVVLNVAEDGKVLLSAQEKDKKETIKEEEKEEQKIELEEEESMTEDKADITRHTPDSLSIHSTGAVSNHSQALSPLSSDEYERMQPAPRHTMSTTSIPPSPSISHASEEYEDMRNWGSNSSRQPSNTSSRQDYELIDSGPPLSNSNDSLYDIPRPPASQNRAAQVESRTSSVGSQAQGSLTPTRPESQQTTTIELGELEEMAPDVPPFTAASGSISSGGSSTLHDRTLSNTSSVHGPPPERDSLGYAKINKRKDEDPNGWLVEQAAAIEGQLPNTTAETLKQVREILRLARIAKMEAEDMKKEAARELELARRDRHDAGLLKKNAAEILKIAKEKLK